MGRALARIHPVLYSATGPKASPTSIRTRYSFSQKCRFYPENGFRMKHKLATRCTQAAESSDVSVMHSRLSARIRKGFIHYCLDRSRLKCKASGNHRSHCSVLTVLLSHSLLKVSAVYETPPVKLRSYMMVIWISGKLTCNFTTHSAILARYTIIYLNKF
jgi:hypothetical protein